MKKYLPPLILASLAFLCANFALAETITPGVQPSRGVLTSLEGAAATFCGGSFNVGITINSSTVYTNSHFLASFGPYTFSIPYLAGDDVQVFGLHVCSPSIGDYAILGGTPGEEITFNTPTSGYSGADFPYFYLAAAHLSTSTLYRFDVLYSLSGGSETYDDFNLSTSPDASALLRIVKSHALPDNTSWSAEGFLYATSTTDPLLAAMHPEDAIATTSLRFFSINVSAPPTGAGEVAFGGESPTSTVSLCGTSTPFYESTSSIPYFILNPPDPIIKYAICSAFAGLFQMTPDQQARVDANYNHATNVIGKKAPFGYFAIGISALNSFSSGSSTPIISTEGMIALDPIFNPLDYGLSAAIGALSLFWLLRRFKHIQP